MSTQLILYCGLLNAKTLFLFLDVAGSIQNVPLLEDLLLREFPPIVPALQAVQFGSDVALSALQQVCQYRSMACEAIL